MRVLLIAGMLGICLSIPPVSAHTSPDTPIPFRRWSVALDYGFALADNAVLVPLIPVGIGPIPDDFRTVSVTFLTGSARYLLGSEFRGFIARKKAGADGSVSLAGENYTLRYSYGIYHSGTVSIFPGVGGGIGFSRLTADGSAVPPLEELRNAQRSNYELCLQRWLLDFHIRGEFRLWRFGGDYWLSRGIDLIVEGGYLHGFGSDSWSLQDSGLSGAPRYSSSGVYLKLGLAFISTRFYN